MRFKLFGLPWERDAADLQKRLEAAGITVLSLAFFDGVKSKWARLGIPIEDKAKLMALNGKLYGGLPLRIKLAA